MKRAGLVVVGLILLGSVILLSLWVYRALQQPAPTAPTMSVTQAYQTVEAELTRAVTLTPQVTATSTPNVPTPTPTQPLTPTPTPTSPTPTFTPTQPCDRAAAGDPLDVTIPDDTQMQPGQTFTKIWRLVNVGACAWTANYAAVWFSGEMMAAPATVPMQETVDPGETVEVAVDMIAPRLPGTYQSNWKLSNAANILFGIGPSGDSPFWVRIVVVEPPTNTPPPSPVPSPTATASPTPEVQVSGSAVLIPGDLVDLDTLVVNGGSGDDLLYRVDESEIALLTPQGAALLGVSGSSPPSLQTCQTASLSNASLPVQSLSAGAYLCYLTGDARYGWFKLISLEAGSFSLNVEILTWAAP